MIQPQIKIDPGDAGIGGTAFFGYLLAGLAAARVQRSGPLLLLTRLLRPELRPGDSYALEVRYVADPGAAAPIACYLLVRYRSWEADTDRLHQAALEFAVDIALLVRHTLRAYSFTPLVTSAALDRALDPFPIADCGEIRRQLAAGPGGGPEHPLPWLGLPQIDDVITMMILQQAPTLLSICAAPLEWRAVASVGGVADNSAQAQLAAMAGAGEDTPRGALLPAAENDDAGWLGLHSEALRRAATLLRIQLAGPAPLRPALINTLAGEIGGPGILTAAAVIQNPSLPLVGGAVWQRPRTNRRPGGMASEAEIARRNLLRMEFSPWAGPDQADGYLADMSEGGRMLALPQHAPWLAQSGAFIELPAPLYDGEGIILGSNEAQFTPLPVVLPLEGRNHHVWIVGHTGTGKSTLLLSMILQDIAADRGVIVIDPHGDLVQQTLERVPRRRQADVILFDPSDVAFPLAINPIEAADEAEQARVVSNFIGLLAKLYDPHQQGIVGPRFEHATRNGLLTIMSTPGNTLIELVRVMTDDRFLHSLLPSVQDPIVRRYWTDQIARTADFHRSEVLDWIVSKFGRFVTDPTIRRIIGQSYSSFSFRAAMDSRKIVLLSLAKGRVGSENANFLGLLLLPKILQAALSRVDLPYDERNQVALYIDEFQNYATDAIASMLAEARKYGLALTLANQHVGQLSGEIRDAVLGNVGSTIAFRLGATDAQLMQQLLAPTPVSAADLNSLPNYVAYGRILLQGERSPTFTLRTDPVTITPDPIGATKIRELSRSLYSKPRAEVDAAIAQRAGPL